MRLTDTFTIGLDPDRAYDLLIDLPRIAPCLPGAELGEPDADGIFPGRVSVKVGPMKFTYDGRVRIVERDAEARTAVIAGEGRASGDADTARVSTRMTVVPDGTGSRVEMATDLEIRGRAAQMGQGIMADVARRLVAQAAGCIQNRLATADAVDAAPPQTGSEAVGGISLMASVVTSRVGDSVRRLGSRGRDTGETEERSR